MGTTRMGHNLEAIMKVMRLALQRGKTRINLTEILEPYSIEGKYPLMHDISNLQSNKDTNSMLPYCSLAASSKENMFYKPECNLFDPVITDLGICHSFNAMISKDMLTPSYFATSFNNAFGSDISYANNTWKSIGSGKDHSLTFYLLDSSVRKMSESVPMSFRMGLSMDTNYYDMMTPSEIIKPGYHTTWKVHAMEIVPSNNLHDIPIKKRNCMFPDETSDLNSFQIYSKKACEFECKIKEAFKTCGCHPWYIPPPASPNRHILCDMYGNYCFRNAMKRAGSSRICSCFPTCHHIEFTHIERESPIDPKVCYDKSIKSLGTRLRAIATSMLDNGYNSLTYNYVKAKEWQEKYKDTKTNKTFERWDLDSEKVVYELCEKIVDHVAIVTVMFDKESYVRTKTSLRVSFTDKLAAFGKILIYLNKYLNNQLVPFLGGTLGLFTGMSILSMIEAVFWLFKLFGQVARPIQNSTLRRQD